MCFLYWRFFRIVLPLHQKQSDGKAYNTICPVIVNSNNTIMGLIGALYHGAKGVYAMINDDSEKANEELDKAVDSLHRTIII